MNGQAPLQTIETIWLNDHAECSIEQLADNSGLTLAELGDLVDNGVIGPVDPVARPPAFYLQTVATAITARRLRDDFELDSHGLTLALRLLQRIGELEREIKALRR